MDEAAEGVAAQGSISLRRPETDPFHRNNGFPNREVGLESITALGALDRTFSPRRALIGKLISKEGTSNASHQSLPCLRQAADNRECEVSLVRRTEATVSLAHPERPSTVSISLVTGLLVALRGRVKHKPLEASSGKADRMEDKEVR